MGARTRSVPSGAGAVVVALVVFCPLAGASMPAKAHDRPMLWGARIGQQFTGMEAPWDWRAVTEFQARNAGGAQLRVLHWSSPWQNPYTGATYRFSTPTFERVRKHHVISFFDWEMNASWFSWGVGASGNTAADFVAAWRHVHDIFAAVGANNVRWVWCPNVDPRHKFADIADLYPGNSYVDWTCLDGYNGDDPWTSFTNLFASSYERILHLAPTKPMIVGEVGSTESGGSKARWIRAMFAALPNRFPRVHGVLWFDKYAKGPGGHSDWPLETSRSASRAFTNGVRSEEISHRRRRRAG